MRTYGQYCPIARASEIFAERWTPLIVRNIHAGCSTYGEILAGLYADPDSVLEKTFDENHRELVLVRDIPISSLCEHHLLPFFGKCHVAYIPNGRVIGLSKIPRLVDIFARRLNVKDASPLSEEQRLSTTRESSFAPVDGLRVNTTPVALCSAKTNEGLEELWSTIADRAATRPGGSYTAMTLEGGVDAPGTPRDRQAGVVEDACGALRRKIEWWQHLSERARELHRKGESLRRITRRLLGREGFLYGFSFGDFSKKNLVRALVHRPGSGNGPLRV